MGCYSKETQRDAENEEYINENQAICLHVFSDLTNVSPAVFIYLLKECYIYGTSLFNLKQFMQREISASL